MFTTVCNVKYLLCVYVITHKKVYAKRKRVNKNWVRTLFSTVNAQRYTREMSQFCNTYMLIKPETPLLFGRDFFALFKQEVLGAGETGRGADDFESKESTVSDRICPSVGLVPADTSCRTAIDRPARFGPENFAFRGRPSVGPRDGRLSSGPAGQTMAIDRENRTFRFKWNAARFPDTNVRRSNENP